MTKTNTVTSVADPTFEARHLRRVLDGHPGCLLRVAASNEILAANDSALELLGVIGRGQALGRALTKWIPDHLDAWREFVDRVVTGARSSIEVCILSEGLHRNVLVHGVPLTDHPDGIASVLLSAHDISERVLLEATIEQLREARKPKSGPSPEELKAKDEQLKQARAEQAATQARLDEALAAQRSIETRFDALTTKYELAQQTAATAIEDQQRAAEASSDREAQFGVMEAELADARKQLAGALVARRQTEERIEALIQEFAAQPKTAALPEGWNDRLEQAETQCAELTRALAAAQAIAAEQREIVATASEETGRVQQALEAVTTQHEQAAAAAAQADAERQRLQALLVEREAELMQMSAARAVTLAQVDDSTTERRRVMTQLAEAEARQEALGAEVAAMQAEYAVRAEELQRALEAAQAAGETSARAAREFEAEHGRLQEAFDRLAAEHQAAMSREAEDRQRLQVLLDLAGEQHQNLQARLQDAEQQCHERQQQLERANDSQLTLHNELQALETAQQEAVARYAADRARLEQLVADAQVARDAQAETLANRDVVLAAMAEHTRRQTPLASIGSVAREIAPQLREVVERVDSLAAKVLEGCRLDHPSRKEAEQLRAEAVRAGALAVELLRNGTEPDAAPRVIVERRRDKKEERA